MIKELPTIKIDNEVYYIDKRLSQIRNINNPNDFENVSLELINFWQENNIKEL